MSAANVLSGIVVALALIPEAIGFSIIAGVDPSVGLYASVVIAIVISFAGGRPAMISAATAATAVLFGALVRDHGLRVSAGRHHPGRHHPDRRGLAARRLHHALRLALGAHRLRQCAGHPDLHGAVARTDRRDLGNLCR